jgi:ferredoxin
MIKKYEINKECIGCKACVEISDKNFSLKDNGKAYVIKQPSTKEEEALCEDAMAFCPTSAIVYKTNGTSTIYDSITNIDKPKVNAYDNIKKILDKHPELKDVLVSLSPKFKRIKNPILYNFLCRFVNFNKASKATNVPINKILETVNSHLEANVKE